MDDVKFRPARKGTTTIVGDLGLPKKHGRGDQKHGKAVKERIVALGATGINQGSIAKQLGISKRYAQRILSESRHNGLQERQRSAMEEHFAPAKEVAEKMIKAMDKGADLYDKFAGTEDYERGPTLREVAYTYHVLSENVLYPNVLRPPAEAGRTRLNIDLKDPAAVRELFAIMRGDEPKAKEIDVTPPKDEKA